MGCSNDLDFELGRCVGVTGGVSAGRGPLPPPARASCSPLHVRTTSVSKVPAGGGESCGSRGATLQAWQSERTHVRWPGAQHCLGQSRCVCSHDGLLKWLVLGGGNGIGSLCVHRRALRWHSRGIMVPPPAMPVPLVPPPALPCLWIRRRVDLAHAQWATFYFPQQCAPSMCAALQRGLPRRQVEVASPPPPSAAICRHDARVGRHADTPPAHACVHAGQAGGPGARALPASSCQVRCCCCCAWGRLLGSHQNTLPPAPAHTVAPVWRTPTPPPLAPPSTRRPSPACSTRQQQVMVAQPQQQQQHHHQRRQQQRSCRGSSVVRRAAETEPSQGPMPLSALKPGDEYEGVVVGGGAAAASCICCLPHRQRDGWPSDGWQGTTKPLSLRTPRRARWSSLAPSSTLGLPRTAWSTSRSYL